MLYHKTVFLADDDCDDQFFFSLALKELCPACSLDTSFDCEELLEKLNNYLPDVPDLIILDINMPRINGIQALSMIRANSAFSKVPIIIYSTSSNANTIKQAYERGANFYLTKPRTFSGLKAEIEQIFSGHLLRQSNAS